MLSFNSYAYDLSRIKVTHLEINKYVKPQLRSLYSDYKAFLNSHNQFYKLTERLLNFDAALEKTHKNSLSACNNLKLCTETLIEARELMQKIELSTLRTSKKLLEDKKCLKASVKCLQIHKIMNDITLSVQKSLSQLDAFYSSNEIGFQKSEIKLSSIEFNLILNKLDLLRIYTIEEQLSQDVEEFHMSFIIPTKEVVFEQNSIPRLLPKLDKFNFILNNFIRNLTKGRKNISREQSKLLKTMHFRWNSILKVILR